MVQPLIAKVQNYEWGKLGSTSKAGTLWNQSLIETDPYAELWMGTHPNAPSYIGQKPLKDIITPETCSKAVFDKYNDLPFLLKVLSIQKALSIQAHPDKILAEKLHKEFPTIYKDPNHKPEMAIALTVFEAFVGFRPLEEIAQFLIDYPEFSVVTSEYQDFIPVVKSTTGDKKQALKKLFSALQHQKPEIIEVQVTKLVTRIENSTNPLDILLCRLNSQYPKDVGIFCGLLLNHVVLQPDEAIFLAANEPHAYLSGDCIECMAASDNVVRSGLTPKFKDVDTLVEMLTYNYGTADSQILRGSGYDGLMYTREYNPPIEEFSILQTKLMGKSETIKGINGPGIMIVTEGKGKLEADGKSVQLDPGSIYFIPAMETVSLTGISTDPFVVYRAFCTV